MGLSNQQSGFHCKGMLNRRLGDSLSCRPSCMNEQGPLMYFVTLESPGTSSPEVFGADLGAPGALPGVRVVFQLAFRVCRQQRRRQQAGLAPGTPVAKLVERLDLQAEGAAAAHVHVTAPLGARLRAGCLVQPQLPHVRSCRHLPRTCRLSSVGVSDIQRTYCTQRTTDLPGALYPVV